MALVASADPSDHTGLIPLERELRERLNWFIRLRWLAVAGIFLGAWVSTSFIVETLPSPPLYGLGLVVACYNALFFYFNRRLGREATTRVYRGLIYAQIGLDWIALICLIHYSGGLQSPATLILAFHLIIGAILLSRRACYLQTALAVLLLGGLLAVEYLGIWPPVILSNPEITPPYSLAACLYRWLILGIFLGVTAFLTTSIAATLRRKEEALFASQQALDLAYREMEVLYQMGQAINATLDLEQVLGLIAESGARLMGMKACSIRLLEQDGRHLRIGAAYGLSKAYLEKGPVRVEKGRIDAEALEGRTVKVSEAATDPRFQYPDEARREGIRAVLCVPLKAKDRAIGCIRIYSGEPHAFSRSEENFLRNLANLGAVAIGNARAYADLRALSEERDWFARVTHHQLRAPLSAAKSMLEALRYAGPLNDKQTDLIARGRRRVDELLDMIRDLLDLAAAQRPLVEFRAGQVVLLDCLADAFETIRDRAAHKKVVVELDAPDPQVVVRADPEDLERIFANLLDNAVKYTPAGGRVVFQIARQGEQVLAVVSDTGIGIDPKDRERIFQGFYRTKKAKATGETGTGMGLSIVKKLVERWNGNLELESTPGKGSRFAVRLPAASCEKS